MPQLPPQSLYFPIVIRYDRQVRNSVFILSIFLFATIATAKPKPKEEPRAPAAPPVRDTSLEDVETLDSLINTNNPPPPPEKEELTRLARLMLQKSPNVKVAMENWQVAQFNTKITRAKILPSANVSDTLGKKGLDPTFIGPDNNYGNLTLSMNEVLYDNGVTLNTLDQNSKAEERLRLEFEYTRDQQLLAVTQSYMDWSQALQAQQLDEAKRKILGRQFAFMDSQFRQGYKSRRDVLRLESELRRVQLDTLSDESNIIVNRATLLDLLGAKPEDLDAVKIHGEETGSVEEPGSGTDAPLKLSEHRRLKILRSREQEAEIGIRLAERDYWPQLRLQADASYTNDNYFQPGVNFGSNYIGSWDALVVLSWTIWDWGIKRNTMQIAKVNSNITADKDRQEELDLDVQLQQLMRKLIEYKTSLNLSHELMTLERQNYTSLENDYRSGKAGYLDLITGINDYIDARTRFMTAYFNLRRQKLAYEFHKGDLFKNLVE
jgi:outer membrane protein TolC